ncbi:MAG TPA: glycosyltransferase [Anaerolineales bacterium]|nr:glycosyltransferase [Anaerolineales bacterium]
MSISADEHPPLVSIILPVHNGEQFLAETIQSVLAQSYHAYELIIVDDGSTDRTREIALSHPSVQYISQAHRGASAARNKGILAARGEYVAFLDADDLWEPDKLLVQIRAFEAHPEADIVTGHIQQFADPDPDSAQAPRYRFAEEPVPGYSVIAIMIRRGVLDKLGLFDEDLETSAEVIDWFVKALEKKPNVLVLPQVVAKRRIHGKNISLIQQQGKNKVMVQILKASIDRKRAGDSK